MSLIPIARVRLLDAVQDRTGGQVKVQRSGYSPEGEVPVIDQGQEFISGYTRTENAYTGPLPVVLFGDHTRAFKFVDFRFALGADGVKVLSPREGFDARFLYYYFRSVQLPNAGYSRHFKFLREVSVPKPSHEEQLSIVDLLSRAEGIVRLRREAQAKAAEVVPALFLDIFGNPRTNPKGWPEARLGELVEEFRYGTSQKSGVAGLATLRIPNVISDRLDPSEMKLVNVTEAEANRLRLRTGDLLFVRTNGNPDYVGRSAVFEAEVMSAAGYDGVNCIYASYLIRARPKPETVRPGFLQSFLSSQEGRRRLREQARTSAGQYNINTEGLSSILVPLPPLDAQAKFEEQCQSVLSVIAQQSHALKRAEAAFNALLGRLFSMNTSFLSPLSVLETGGAGGVR